MAIRNRGSGSQPWQVYWNNPYTGKRESISFATKEEAEKENSLIIHRLKYERESFRPIDVVDAKSLTLEETLFLYLKAKQFNKVALQCQMAGFKPILAEYGQVEVEAIGKDVFRALQVKFAQTGLKQTSIHIYLSRLKTVLNWAIDQGFRQKPLERIVVSSGHYEKFVTPSLDELEKIFAVASPRMQRVVVLGAYFGVRMGDSELLQLTWADVDLQAMILHVHGSKKNAESPWRDVPIKKELLPTFQQWQKEDDGKFQFLVHAIKKDSPACIFTIRHAWQRTLKRAEITRRIRLYDLRHYFGTELIAAGVDVGTIAKLMGHSDPTMLLTHYQYVKSNQKVAAIEKLPSMCLSRVPGKS